MVELSVNPLFRRGYSALYAAIAALGTTREAVSASELPAGSLAQHCFPSAWIKAIAGVVPVPEHRAYWLFGVDVTPVERCHAVTMKDRESVYQPTVITGQKPITLGHNYSLIAAIPEAAVASGRSWIVPVSVERVTSFASKTSVGQRQVERLLNDASLPWYEDLCGLVVDRDYSHRRFLFPFSTQDQRVILTRCQSNRVFDRLPAETVAPRRGHPRWYGERFDLKDDTTWQAPDQQDSFSTTTAQGKPRRVTLSVWHDLLMKGARAQPMHRYPFDLVQVQLSDPSGNRLFKPQWLIVFGQARRQLPPRAVEQAYTERFKLEHGIRFSKQRLLLTQLQTPAVTQEENWVQFSWLAYVQLWVARLLANLLPQPWQRS